MALETFSFLNLMYPECKDTVEARELNSGHLRGVGLLFFTSLGEKQSVLFDCFPEDI